jgi:hypothetical protein
MVAFEKHYSVEQIAELWHLAKDTIRRIFINEPGVLTITRPETRFKRSYTTIRIPHSVALRVHERLRAKNSRTASG